MILATTLDPFLDQLQRMVWTLVVPGFFLATLAGLALRWVVERLAIGAARWWLRRGRGPATVGNLLPVIATPAATATVPACPACAQPIARRTARRGASVGRSFWGCSGYPTCRATRSGG